jgi:hypothetical protein
VAAHIVLLLHTVVCCCSPIYDAYCQKHYANGHCDYGCNNEECNWDGLDCEQQQPKVAEGMLYFVVLMSMQTFHENLVTFLREVSVPVCVLRMQIAVVGLMWLQSGTAVARLFC